MAKYLFLILLVAGQFSSAFPNSDFSKSLERLLDRCPEENSWQDEARCYRRGIRDILDDSDNQNNFQCIAGNVYGKYAAGGGCNVYGCYYPGGGCNVYGCYYEGGSCDVYNCFKEAPKTNKACTD